MNYISIEKAIQNINSGDRVFIHSGAMAPIALLNEMSQQYKRLKNVELIGIHTEGEATYTKPPYSGSFFSNSLFVSGNIRKAVNEGFGSYVPVLLNEVSQLYNDDFLPIDVALIQVSPPDKHGYCSLGVSVDISLSAIKNAKKIIALVNPQVPKTCGDGFIHFNEITAAVEYNSPINVTPSATATEIEENIGSRIAELIDDGATLQMGIGAIPNVVFKKLRNHKRLGIHTELLSDGILHLLDSGAITGEEKVIDRGNIITCFSLGNQALFDFVNDNPLVRFKESSYTNNPLIIAKNPKVTAINSAVEIDITGQICAENVGDYHYSGVGGQMDFVRGSLYSKGGKPIFAFSSQTGKGISKIVSRLKPGAAVTTTRAFVRYVVTEYGAVNLFGKNLSERAKLLISIAHPDHRERLEREAYEILKQL